MIVCDVAGFACYHGFENLAYIDYDHLYASHGVCGCLDDCNLISYEIEFVNDKFDQNYNSTLKNEASMKFAFKDEEFYSKIRYQQFTVQDFLSYAGGLMGEKVVD
jgi:hypothetical protein